MTHKSSQQHFNTDDLSASLKQRSIRSGMITFASQPLKLVLIGSTAILARLLLTPGDFGLLAMATPLFLLVDSLSSFGLEMAVVQKDCLNQQQASAVFWQSLKINALLIGITVLLAPVFARFYHEARLTGMILGLAVGAFSVCLAFNIILY